MIVFSEDDDKFLDQYNHRLSFSPPATSSTATTTTNGHGGSLMLPNQLNIDHLNQDDCFIESSLPEYFHSSLSTAFALDNNNNNDLISASSSNLFQNNNNNDNNNSITDEKNKTNSDINRDRASSLKETRKNKKDKKDKEKEKDKDKDKEKDSKLKSKLKKKLHRKSTSSLNSYSNGGSIGSNVSSTSNNSNNSSNGSSNANVSSTNLLQLDNTPQKKLKQRDWFESESSHDDHQQISVLITPIQKYYQPGDTLDIVVNVNVKKLQCLNATFEGYSTCNLPVRESTVPNSSTSNSASTQSQSTTSSNSFNLLKSKIVSTDFHLYPTEFDKLSSSNNNNNEQQNNNIPNLNNLTNSTSSMSTNSNYNNSTKSLPSPRTTLIYNNSNNNKSNSTTLIQNENINGDGEMPNFRKVSISADDVLLNNNLIKSRSSSSSIASVYSSDLFDEEWTGNDDDQQLNFSNGKDYHHCIHYVDPLPNDLEDIDNTSSIVPPHVHSRCDHLVLSRKKHRFSFQLTIPSNLPPSFAFSKSSKNGVFYRIHLSGLGQIHNKFNPTEHSLIKGFETSIPMHIWNPKCNFLPRHLLQTDHLFSSSETFESLENNIRMKSRLLVKNFCVIDSAISVVVSIDNQSNQIIKGFQMELINIQQIFRKSSNDNSKTTENHLINRNVVQSISYAKQSNYHIQPQSKQKYNITFYIPNNIIPSISLDNLSNSYVIKISSTGKNNSSNSLEIPLLIIPSPPSQ